uniref:Uncharacterized protein n=1 Tax=Chromera velia CCMP2878 TaxID=1169474 RepID=A0A0G4GRQ0_9ALVE|eukprot:Cvel_23020.t1-p1 / transcript=Cvel_23020.t1 / gene=Cvel_23020 / organism=Chromera_velia_CCMP2878 / gene_product=hypothetical protein / transcript_product=hypothetical protein / location=Cvel_scaffold2325:575-2356(-) / protein_length=518 / sequence_SO=supercontig / SO=protein_coding / is_pseudo=false
MKTSTHSAALSSSSPKKEREKGSHCDAATQMAPSRSLGCRAAPFPSLRALSPSARSRSSSSLQGRHSPPVSKGPQPEEPHNINIGRCVCEWMQTTEDDVPDRTRTSDVRRAAAQHTRGITRPAWRLRQRSREADVELPFDWEISVGHLRSRLCARVNEKRRRQWDRWSEKATEAPGFPSSSSTPAPPPLPDGSALEICEEGRKALVNPWSSSSASGGLAIDLEEEGDAAPCEVSWGGFQKEKEIEREMERVELKYEQDSFLFPEGEEEEREAGGEEEKVQRELCAPKAEEAWVIGEVKEEKNKDSHIAQGAPSKTQEGAAPAPRNNNASCLTKTQQNPPEGHSCIPKAALPKGNTCPQSTAPSSAVADALDRCLTAVSSFGFVPAHSAHSRPERRMSPQSLPTQSGGEERETLGGKEEGRGNAVPLQVPFMERQRLLFLSRQQAAQAREGRGPKELVEQGRKESPLLSSPQQVQPRQGSPLVVPQNDEPLKAQSPHAAIAQKLLHTVLSRTVASSSSL